MKRIFSVFILLSIGVSSYAQDIYDRTLKLMGSRFDITVVADDQAQAEEYIDLAVAEISRIEKLISSWDPASQTSEINQNAGIKPVAVDKELYQLIERAIRISELSDGAFDISYASIDRIWKFDGSVAEAPDTEVIARSVENIGYENILLDPVASSVFLKKEGMKIGFGAIGKGYAADKAKALLINQGVDAGIINASGDMNTWGTKPDGSPWRVAITNPFDKTKPYASLPIQHGAVVTSGNYEKFIMIDDQRYAHIIDPRTGWPTQGILSVTIFAPKAELADALATAVFVMGKSAGLDRINQLPRIECIIVDKNGDLHTSNQIKIATP
ncbi:MAG: FAD:protein FMN transferase [Cyclobacteriaceae bacterium]